MTSHDARHTVDVLTVIQRSQAGDRLARMQTRGMRYPTHPYPYGKRYLQGYRAVRGRIVHVSRSGTECRLLGSDRRYQLPQGIRLFTQADVGHDATLVLNSFGRVVWFAVDREPTPWHEQWASPTLEPAQPRLPRKRAI